MGVDALGLTLQDKLRCKSDSDSTSLSPNQMMKKDVFLQSRQRSILANHLVNNFVHWCLIVVGTVGQLVKGAAEDMSRVARCLLLY
jgi:hypothetical protein